MKVYSLNLKRCSKNKTLVRVFFIYFEKSEKNNQKAPYGIGRRFYYVFYPTNTKR